MHVVGRRGVTVTLQEPQFIKCERRRLSSCVLEKGNIVHVAVSGKYTMGSVSTTPSLYLVEGEAAETW